MSEMEWRSIETAPRDGTKILVYRPLAAKTQDEPICVKRSTPGDRGCWPATIPEGCDGKNFTDGYCYATHWMPLPSPPPSPNAM